MLPNLSSNNAKIVEEILGVGCTKEEILHSLSEPKSVQTSIMVTPLQSRSKDQLEGPQSTSQKQGIKLKFQKHKPGMLAGTSNVNDTETKGVQKIDHNMPEGQIGMTTNQPQVTKGSDFLDPISRNAMKIALRQIGTFCDQQISQAQIAQGVQKNLRDKIIKLEVQAQKMETN